MTDSLYKLSKQHMFTPPTGLPSVASDLEMHTESITAALDKKLSENNNYISFAEYMQFCLYQPQLGYYSGGLHKFGQDGDFTTAPEVSVLFGECIAQAIAPLLSKNTDWDICELGPGRGALAEAIINHLNKLDALPQSYQLLEVSASLSDLQKSRLKPLHKHLEIKHLQEPPKKFKGIIIGNEVIDALVVERFYVNEQGGIFQIGVSIQDARLVEVAQAAPDYLVQAIQNLDIDIPKNFKSDICCQLKPWLKHITENCEEAILLFSDYGFSQSEYYSPERNDGTIRCHYRQHAHNNALVLPALQDITAWVDFTALGNAALSLGMEIPAYSTQAHVLLGSGHLQTLDFEAMTEVQRFKTSQEIQTLTLPANMGERFRFMQLNKNCDEVIPAMQLRDLRHQL